MIFELHLSLFSISTMNALLRHVQSSRTIHKYQGAPLQYGFAIIPMSFHYPQNILSTFLSLPISTSTHQQSPNARLVVPARRSCSRALRRCNVPSRPRRPRRQGQHHSWCGPFPVAAADHKRWDFHLPWWWEVQIQGLGRQKTESPRCCFVNNSWIMTTLSLFFL